MPRRAIIALGLLAGSFLSSAGALAQMVNLPYVLRDERGSTWDVQHDGSIGDGGNDLYDGGGHLYINGQMQYSSHHGQAVHNAQSNEILLPRIQLGVVMVSRRVAVIRHLNCARFVEVIENPTAQSVRVGLRCYFNMGGSVSGASPLVDPKRGKGPIGYAITDHRQALAMIGAARSSKILPQFQYQLNNDNVNIIYSIDIPARQSVAVAHFQFRGNTSQHVTRLWQETRERDLLKDLPKDIRAKIVNWPVGEFLPGNLEMLRGDSQDIVELRAGDRYRGTVKLDTIKLQTLYGTLEIPASKVVCLFNSGTYRPSQLVVTVDGDVFGGRVSEKTLELHLGWGQITHVPLGQITRIGFRKRPGDTEDQSFENKAAVYLSDGQRIRIHAPRESLSFATLMGSLKLPPSAVSSIVFQDDDTRGVPDVRLVDGSRISALTVNSWMDLHSPGAAPAGRQLHLPTNSMLRVVLGAERDVERLAPVMVLANQDQLIGVITGTLSLQTPFDTIHVEGPQIKKLSRITGGKGGDRDVQIALWDDSVVSGRLNEAHIAFSLRCGVALHVPIGLVDQYTQPLPQPSDRVVQEINRILLELDSDDFSVREDAQRKIVSIGPPAMSVLRKERSRASLEALRRIEVMLGQLEKELDGKSPMAPIGVPQIDEQVLIEGCMPHRIFVQ